jgi:hypothetical protein
VDLASLRLGERSRKVRAFPDALRRFGRTLYQQAEQADDPIIKYELLELASVYVAMTSRIIRRLGKNSAEREMAQYCVK